MPDLSRCPICGRPFSSDGPTPRAFCSERCRAIDLGGWLEGRYRISTLVPDGEDELGLGNDEPKGE